MAYLPRTFPVRITASYDGALDGAREIVPTLRPDWSVQDIVYKPMTEGYVNYSVCCHLEGDGDLNDALVVRVDGDNMENIVNRRMEMAALQVAHAAGCCKRPLALFKNGFVCEYATGDTVEIPRQLYDKNLHRTLAYTMARLHEFDPHSVHIVDNTGARLELGTYTCYDRMRDWIDLLPDHLPDPLEDESYQQQIKPRSEYRAEVALLEATFKDQPFVFGHNDCNPSNLIYNKAEGTIKMIDFEYASFTVAPLEWGYFFSTLMHGDDVFEDWPSLELSDELVSMYLRPYLEHRLELQGKLASDLTEETLRDFCTLSRAFIYVTGLFWGLMSLSVLSVGQLRKSIDMLTYGFHIMKRYYENRHLVFPDFVCSNK